MKKKRLLAMAVPAALLIVAGVVVAQGWETTVGVGTDLAAEAKCLSCHVAINDAWSHASTHKLIHDCLECHHNTAPTGKGHADSRACADCHSEKSHHAPETACGVCHDVHGTANAFLVKGSIQTPAGAAARVFLSRPEGKSDMGLARGVAGTGVCEVCHTTTKYYTAAGTGAAHPSGGTGADAGVSDTVWCITCHSHQNGFAPGPVE